MRVGTEGHLVARAERWAVAQLWRLDRRAARNRRRLYQGETGLRIVTFHHTGPHEMEQLRRLVAWARGRMELGEPEDADDLVAGRWRRRRSDRLLLTFDDGLESNFEAARWLAAQEIRAVFFVIPSFVGRTVTEFLDFHRRSGVTAHPPGPPGAPGLAVRQVREMAAMGHRIGAHNFAHRDLGRLRAPADIEYEVGRALESVGEIVGSECDDFAIGFGQPENVSDEAAAWLLAQCPRVHACHRGLNVPGLTPRFLLRDDCKPWHPFAFTRACLEGGGDHHLADRAREMARRVGVLPGGSGPLRSGAP